MDDEKRKRLEEAGWKVGDADEFLADMMPEHGTDAARGIVNGLLLSIPIWVCICLVVYLLTSLG